MIIGPQEIVLVFLVVIILFGASKIPELARSIGKATGEYKKARHETENELRDVEKSLKEGHPIEEKSSKIKQMANDLEIVVGDKSDEQLLDEIQKKVKK
ncbi:twin arginine-targeting protein translocase, TatA/E family [Candidatus Methanoperedens nitroreducens]|uniref:Twin arginine-targeting protein translocase, TatA/E family n=1 Tax=Candidatus Methanoperedens nitratireducens TaxID=1392998 RepID=A0A062UZA6_9EURY|nr:twin-arginine translocase TatA/TatE family subunit [Candidatus Methanoperedens nitroreducens]KCZ70457.1 twin arginine-targeting protein translocase, TatA/E family [Candidatus Methanoperedens nitroreducens]MDJ1420895.1 twin-arginine translocase TatA/TatE family subunit [Candidatus Methanoperedens sp.]